MQRDGIFVRWRTGAPQPEDRAGPDFLYIGCQKAGSSWLYDQLSGHPDFWMPPVKELHYFDGHETGAGMATLARRAGHMRQSQRRKWFHPQRDAAGFFARVAAGDGGKLDLDWYASLFRWKGNRLSGDITPAYSTLSADMIGIVTTRFPDLRCILFVRDPVARVWSQACNALLRKGKAMPENWSEMVSFLSGQLVATRSYPTQTFARWSDHVAADRIFVGFFDQLVARPDLLRTDVLQFLGANPSCPGIAAGFDSKRDQMRAPCPPEMQRRLADWFADEMHACARTFGGPATDWPVRYGLVSAGA